MYFGMIYNTVSIKCDCMGIKTYGYQKYHMNLNISVAIDGGHPKCHGLWGWEKFLLTVTMRFCSTSRCSPTMITEIMFSIK